jgi:hypothetical protein
MYVMEEIGRFLLEDREFDQEQPTVGLKFVVHFV